MKASLALLVLLLLGAGAAMAQPTVPYVQVFPDETFDQDFALCPPGPPGTVVDELYVVAINFNAIVNAVELRIDYPSYVIWLADVVTNLLPIGSSPSGIAIGYPAPLDAFQPVLLFRVVIVWMCSASTCYSWQSVCANVHPGSGYLRAVRWADQTVIYATNNPMGICPVLGHPVPPCESLPVPVSETSWGEIKSLFR